MKRLVLFVAAALSAVFAWADTTYTWSGGTSTLQDMKELANDANWDLGTYPDAADAVANVSAAGSGAYVSLTNAPMTLKSMSGNGTYIVGDKLLTLGANSSSLKLYTPLYVSSSGSPLMTSFSICDELTVKSGILANSSEMTFHDDFWAKSGGDIDRTAAKIASATEYHGSFCFYSPLAAAGSWNFTLTEGSPFVKTKSGFATYQQCSAGQFVRGSGVRDGTFVKRIFDSDWMELSEPATNTIAEAPLVFSARKVKVLRSFGELGFNGSTDHNTTISAWRNATDEDYTVEVDKLLAYPVTSGGCRKLSLGTSSTTYLPARLLIHNTRYPGSASAKSHIILNNCWLEFGATTYDSSAKATPAPGLPWSEVQFGSGCGARMTVPSGLDAVVGKFLSFAGPLTKDGAGSLTVGLTDDTTVGTAAGVCVDVEEGTFAFADVAGAQAIRLPTLKVAAGATFVVPAQGVTVTSGFSIASGATIAGTGTLTLPSVPKLTGVTLAPTVTIALPQTGAQIVDVPAPATESTLPGEPAFWVDCSKTNTMTLVTLASTKQDSTIGVYRINDVRKTSEDDKYLFSTNCSGSASTAYMPVVQWDKRKNLHHVYFQGRCGSGAYTVDQTDAHAWSRPVGHIRTVFQVYGCNNRGEGESTTAHSMPFLGMTTQNRCKTVLAASGEDCIGAACWGRYSSTACFLSWATSAMKAGTFRVNGVVRNPSSDKPPYGSPIVRNDNDQAHSYRCHPMVVDMTIPDTYASSKLQNHVADSYTFVPSYASQGCVNYEAKRLFELIVYTNLLSEAEIASVRRYLMRKWLSQDAPVTVDDMNPSRLDVANGSLEIASGDEFLVESFASGASFTKKGAGLVSVEDAYAPTADVAVSAGTLQLRSFDLSRPMTNADDQVSIHLDASVADSAHFDYAYDEARGVKTVTKWKDVKASPSDKRDFWLWQSGTTNRPFIVENKLNGHSVLDFGAFYSLGAGEDVSELSSAMVTYLMNHNHGVIAVWGSEHGGGSLLGESETYWSNGIGISRNQPTYGAAASDPIFMSELHQSFVNTSAYLTRKNGVSVVPTTTGLSGTFDLVSHVAWSPFSVRALQVIDNDKTRWMGGGQFGEMLIMKIGPAAPHLDELEAYFRKKWFNLDTDGYREASIKSLAVAPGATVEVTGGGPLNVATLAVAGGTVRGAVKLAAGAELAVTVNDDGTVTPLAIDGAVDFSQGGTVKLTGATEKLQKGEYTLVTGVGDTAAANWTVDTTPLRKRYRRNAEVYVADGDLRMRLNLAGVVFTIR